MFCKTLVVVVQQFQGIHVFMLGLNSKGNASLTLNVPLALGSVMGAVPASTMAFCLHGLLSNLTADNLAKSYSAHARRYFTVLH